MRFAMIDLLFIGKILTLKILNFDYKVILQCCFCEQNIVPMSLQNSKADFNPW